MPNQAIENIEHPRKRKFITDDSLDIFDIFQIVRKHDLTITIKSDMIYYGYMVIIRHKDLESVRIFLKHHVEVCGKKFIYDCIDEMMEDLLNEQEKRGNRQ